MALFQKQPITNSSVPPYTTSAARTYLIIGLGNPGKQYNSTRHNIGFAAVENFAKTNDFPSWTKKRDLGVEMNMTSLVDNRVILIKPQKFMNLSGEAVNATQKFYKIANTQTLVIYDELAIPFGQIRLRVGGADAGHNGVRSLISHVGEDFGRLRIGIGNNLTNKTPAEKFVLAKFDKTEKVKVPDILREASSIISEYIFSGQLPHDTRSIT